MWKTGVITMYIYCLYAYILYNGLGPYMVIQCRYNVQLGSFVYFVTSFRYDGNVVLYKYIGLTIYNMMQSTVTVMLNTAVSRS